MKTINQILVVLALVVALSITAFGQAAMTTTTLTANVGNNTVTFPVASATGMVAPSGPNGVKTILYIDHSAYFVQAINGLNITVIRGARGTYGGASHLKGSTVYVGPDSPSYFAGAANAPAPALRGSCTATNQPVLPVIEVSTGRAFTCTGSPGYWGVITAQYIPPTQCTFAPTTLTTTNTYPQIGASNVFVLNAVSNAAAGTNTLVCNIFPDTQLATSQGAILLDVTLFVGSQVVAPTSLGTATLGSITFPAAATSETPSTVTPVTVGGTITTTSPTAITTVTTAGAFLTIKHTFSSVINLSTDLQMLQYTMPFVQSAASAMTLNTPGLLLHYIAPPSLF